MYPVVEDLARETMRNRMREAGDNRLAVAVRRTKRAERMAQRAARAKHRRLRRAQHKSEERALDAAEPIEAC